MIIGPAILWFAKVMHTTRCSMLESEGSRNAFCNILSSASKYSTHTSSLVGGAQGAAESRQTPVGRIAEGGAVEASPEGPHLPLAAFQRRARCGKFGSVVQGPD